MITRNLFAVVLLSSLGFAVGCEVPELEGLDAPSAMPKPQANAEKTDAEPEKKKGWEQTELVDTEPAVTSTPREVTANDPTKGKRSRQAGGYLGAVGHARFYAEHKLIFTSIDHALNLYWATNGEYPKTHDEFMEKIVKFNQIQLPELDEGVEYIYTPEDHKLKIHRPGAPVAEGSQDDEQKEEQKAGEQSASGMSPLPDVVSETKRRQITQALEFYKTSNNEKYPESHEQFMEKIIQEFKIELPELETGFEYVYDPSDHTLKVHRPGDENEEN